MNKSPSLKRNAIALLIMQVINYSVPIITLPYLTRVLGVEQYGALNLALSLTQYGILFITFGFNLSATQYIARHRHQPLLISRAFWETIAAKSLLLLIASGVISIITLNIDSFYPIRWLVFILFLQFISTAIDPLWFFQGIEKLGKISLIGSTIRILNIPLLLIFVHSPKDTWIAALIQAGILLLIAIINIYLVKKENILVIIKINQLKIKKALIGSLPIFIGTAAISLYNTSTPIILGLVSSYDEVGVYSASFRLQTAAIGIFTVLGQVIYPRVNHLFATDLNAGYSFVKKLLIYMFPILLISCILFYYIVPVLAPWALGKGFASSKETIKIMTPLLFLIPYSVVFAHNILLPMGFKKLYYMIPLILGVIHIVYSYVLSKHFGAIGASISVVITEILTFIILLIVLYAKTDIFKKTKVTHKAIS